ncbi:MAG: hypothetical protein ACRD1K_09970 [Acidimicrobiales bacterium]
MARSTEREVQATADTADTADTGDWTVRAADAIEQAVGAVRDKTAVPLATVARVLVFGLLALVVGAAVVILLTIGLVRLVNVAVPGQVWSAYLAVGGIFTGVGGFLLRKARTSLRNVPKGEESR